MTFSPFFTKCYIKLWNIFVDLEINIFSMLIFTFWLVSIVSFNTCITGTISLPGEFVIYPVPLLDYSFNLPSLILLHGSSSKANKIIMNQGILDRKFA